MNLKRLLEIEKSESSLFTDVRAAIAPFERVSFA